MLISPLNCLINTLLLSIFRSAELCIIYILLLFVATTTHLVLRFIINDVPTPILLLTLTLPPIFSMMFLQIERPRPVPPLFKWEFSYSFEKLIKSLEIPSSLMPRPVSIMLIWKLIRRVYPITLFSESIMSFC